MLNSILGIGASLLAPKLMAGVQNQKVQVLHASPGRVRLQCDRWKNEQTARNLKSMFQKFPIVKGVDASPITGSLVLVFHTKTLTPEQFDSIVKSAVETSVATYPELQADLMNVLTSLMRTVDTTVKKQSGGRMDIDSLLSVTLIISGLLKYSTSPTFATSLLYWAYSIIDRNKAVRYRHE